MNEKSKEVATDFNYSFQEYLSFGYVALIALGLIKDIIQFKILGINILHYSSVYDILVSPLGILLNHNRPLKILFGLILVFIIFKILGHFIRKSNIKKGETPPKTNFTGQIWLVFLFFFSMNFSFGIAKGFKTQKRIEEGKLKVNCELVFNDKAQEKVHLLGQNSQFIFYLKPTEKEVSVSPILSNIKTIKRLEE